MSTDKIQHNQLSDGLLQDRAFVIRLGSEAATPQNLSAGRVEHINSGQATHFQLLPELVLFQSDIA